MNPIRVLASAVVVAFVATSVVPVLAQTTPIPETAQIEDPANDGNFLNDQDLLIEGVCEPPCQANHDTGGNDASTVGDLLKVWFTNTATHVSVHIMTQAAPPASTTQLFRVYSNAGEGSVGSDPRGCLQFRAIFKGATQGQDTSTYRGDDVVEMEDTCNVEAETATTDGEVLVEDLGDTGGLVTLTFPRTGSPLLAAGGSIVAPYATTRLVAGTSKEDWRSFAQIDNTERGTDYALADESAKKKKKKKKKAAGPAPFASDPADAHFLLAKLLL